MSDYKKEIEDAEKAFCEMTAEKGIKEAFLEFADVNAVLMRGGKLFKGKTGIKKYFDEIDIKILSLVWKASFIEVAESGDLGYTYGDFTIKFIDEFDEENTVDGIFHTVWKRQSDGNWKYVYD